MTQAVSSVQDYPNIRRLEDISPGKSAWSEVWNSLDFTANDELRVDQLSILRTKTIEKLSELETKDYHDFCFHAGEFESNYRQKTNSEVIFPDLPNYLAVRADYIEEIKKIRKKSDKIHDHTNPAAWGCGIMGFIFGAMIAGEVIDNQYTIKIAEVFEISSLIPYIERISSAFGGVIGGVAGLVGMGIFFEGKERKVRDEETKLENKIKTVFQERVKDYVIDSTTNP